MENIFYDLFRKQYPHLSEVIDLYEKTVSFGEIVSPLLNDKAMPRDAVLYGEPVLSSAIESFTVIFDIPDEEGETFARILRTAQVDFTQLPNNRLPIVPGIPVTQELMQMFFIFSRPFFRYLADVCRPNDTFWLEGRCPVCNAGPTLAYPLGEALRRFSCSYCSFQGEYGRTGCPFCGGPVTDSYAFENAPGYRIDACPACLKYVKTVFPELGENIPPDLADIISLPADIVAQEKGFRRSAPNPIGLAEFR